MQDVMSWIAVVAVGGCVAISLAVLKSNRRSIVRWSFVAGMIALAAEAVFNTLALQALDARDIVNWQRAALLTLAVLPAPWVVFGIMFARAEAGRFTTQRKWMTLASILVPFGLGVLFWDGLAVGVVRFQLSNEFHVVLGKPGVAMHIFFLTSSVAVLMNLERTFRASVGTIRWRIKFMLIALGALFVVRIYTSSQALLFSAVKSSLSGIDISILPLVCLLMTRSLFREGVFNVTVYPSRAVLQNSITVLSVGVYLLLVGLLAKIVTALGGDAAFPLKAFLVLLALAALTVLLLSDRLRQRTRLFVSRHFSRPLHDYQKVWRSFTERTTSLMTEPELCRAVSRLISEIFQVLSVTIWLIDGNRRKLVVAASTSLTESSARDLSGAEIDITATEQGLVEQPNPFDMDKTSAAWLAPLKERSPVLFKESGNRVCVPLMAGGNALGMITLVDRVSGLSFSAEDMDLFKSIGDQVAASLQRIQLSEKLLQARELEAFQTMSAFFVHDLKNTASTLSLMLRNLSEHFEDPAFRADAVRAVGKSVERINALISRLGLIREAVQLTVEEADLNGVITTALAGLGGDPKAVLKMEFQSVPRLRIDTDQIQKVVTNLVLNSWEAMGDGGGGEVVVGTESRDGWAVISVRDNGCGMTPEFISRSLFKPFQTTKKKGIGIGMFHCKAIVEAHRGRIEVASEQGKGTTFRVHLPIENKKP
jgi:putative PEP-CTERM system histidine kinase